jgi:hypothetical protein
LRGARRHRRIRERVVKSIRTVLAACAAAVLAGGCALPTATYSTYKVPRAATDKVQDADIFLLAKTKLEVKAVEVGEDEPQKFAVSVVRAGDPRVVFGIKANRKWYGVVTTLSITKVANTSLVDAISSEVEDKRVEFVKSAVKFVGTALGVGGNAASGAKALVAPAIHDLQPLLDKRGRGAEVIEVADGLELTIEAVPNDAIEVSKLEIKDLSRVFVYSACRPAVLKVTADKVVTLMNITVADARYAQTVSFPLKGKIQTHTQCGVSVIPEKATVTSDIDVAQTALEEVLKLREAINKKSDAGGSK